MSGYKRGVLNYVVSDIGIRMSAYTDIRPYIIRYDIGYDIWNYTILISCISYTISHPISHPDQLYIGIY